MRSSVVRYSVLAVLFAFLVACAAPTAAPTFSPVIAYAGAGPVEAVTPTAEPVIRATVTPVESASSEGAVPWGAVVGVLGLASCIAASIYVAYRQGGRGTLLAICKSIAGELVFAAERYAREMLIADANGDGVPDGQARMEWVLTAGYNGLPEKARTQIEGLATLLGVEPRALLRSLAQEAFERGKATLDYWMAEFHSADPPIDPGERAELAQR